MKLFQIVFYVDVVSNNGESRRETHFVVAEEYEDVFKHIQGLYPSSAWGDQIHFSQLTEISPTVTVLKSAETEAEDTPQKVENSRFYVPGDTDSFNCDIPVNASFTVWRRLGESESDQWRRVYRQCRYYRKKTGRKFSMIRLNPDCVRVVRDL